jgi:hypothetical protein
VIDSLAAGATQIISPGTYDIVWNDGYTEHSVVVGKCGPTISTVASPASGTVGVAMTVGDTATATGAVIFANGGSVTFSLYKGATCSGTPVATGSGVLGAISAGKATAAYSTSWTPPAAGTYTWGISFAGDLYNNSYSACGGSGETVTINKASPTIATVASPNSGMVGVAMSVGDTATLSGGSGFGSSDTVAFALYSGVAPTACNGVAVVSGSGSLSNGLASFSASWTPSSAGTYTWGVNFAGDTNNNAISACGGAHETVTVANKTGITISTLLSESTGTVGDSVHDTAILSVIAPNVVSPHAVAISPTVTYTVYTDSTCKTKFQDAGTVTVAANGVVPNSNPVTFNSPGTYYWQAVYSGDGTTTSATSRCTDETLIIGKAGPTIATQLSEESGQIGDKVHDTATLTGATSTAGGSVKYTVYTDSECTLGARDAGTVGVTNALVPVSNAITFDAVGTWYWQAVYSGDANNSGATSSCRSETLVIDPTPFESFEGETAFPSTNPSTTPFESFKGETSNPTRVATLPPTSSDGNGTNDPGTPLFVLLISLAFGALGLVAVKAQRRSLRA